MANPGSNDGKGRRRPSHIGPPRRTPSNESRIGAGFTRLTIGSDFAASRDVQRNILDGVHRCGFNSQSTFAIKLALEEAMINAIKHGNRLDPSKSVHVAYRITPRQVEIVIEDEGAGFDRHGVPDPTADENLEKCCGRGILLMEAYMNTVEFSRGGRRVRMVKKNEPDALVREASC